MQHPSTHSVSQATNLVDVLRQSADRYDSKPALIGSGGKGTEYSYRELIVAATQIASGLVEQHLLDPVEIGLLSENRPDWCVAYFAILAAGGTVVPLDANLGETELLGLVERAGLKAVFCSGKFERMLTEHAASIRVLSFEKDSDKRWTRITENAPKELEPSSNETAVLIYTSGTTGSPKAVELTHQNLIANIASIQDSLKIAPTDTFLSVLPLHHTFEATCGFLVPLTAGASIVYARSLKSRDILEDIAANDVNLMCGVPLLYEKIYQGINRKLTAAPWSKKLMVNLFFWLSRLGWLMGRGWGQGLFGSLRRKAGLHSIRLFVSGGAPLPPVINRFFNLLGFKLVQGYGMTECSPVLSVNRPEQIRFDTVGPPLSGIDVRIDNPNEEGIGEICVRGGNVTPGYRDNPEATAELIRDGWLHTGDLGCLDQGHIRITGRAKNLIVSAAGKNIYPEELEEHLMASRYILEAVVYGRRKENRQGEEVRAILVPDLEQFEAENILDSSHGDAGAIRSVFQAEVSALNRRLADYKRIAAFDLQLEELEKTSTRKVKRFKYN